MTTNAATALVLKDGEGTYYLLTPELLAQAKVSAEQQAALEQALAGADTTGFSWDAVSPGARVWPDFPVHLGADFRLLAALPTTALGLKAGASE